MKKQLAIGAALAAAVVLGATIVAFGNAQTSAPASAADAAPREDRARPALFADAEEAEIQAIIRDYLLDNPEVILEAVQGYQVRQREKEEAAAIDGARENLQALLNEADGYAIGADTAKARVAVIEMFDYHCGHCKSAMGLVQDLARKDPAVKVVFRELPILREESELAARAALAARKQGKYAEMYFAMMGASGVLNQDRINDIARSKGLDVAALEKAMNAPEVSRAIDETHKIADAMGVDGTPAFIIASLNGDYLKVIPGYNEDAIRQAIAEAKKS